MLAREMVKSANHLAPYYIRQPNRLRLVYLNNDHPTTFQELHEPSPNIANSGRLANFVRGCCTILCPVADLGLDRGGFESEELKDVGARKRARILSHAHISSATPMHLRQVAKVPSLASSSCYKTIDEQLS